MLDEVLRYYQARGLVMPSTDEAMLFLVSEIGELADALVTGRGAWVRNNPGRERSIPDELADVMMMTLVLAHTLGVDPNQALREKMARKLGSQKP